MILLSMIYVYTGDDTYWSICGADSLSLLRRFKVYHQESLYAVSRPRQDETEEKDQRSSAGWSVFCVVAAIVALVVVVVVVAVAVVVVVIVTAAVLLV